MEMLEEYFCWLEGQREGDAKIVKSDSVREAAKLAMDSWRHEGSLFTRKPSLLVYVKDDEGQIHHVTVNQDLYLDDEGPRV
jgi:hypothetical protein